MAESLPLIKRQLSIESEKVTNQINIKTKSIKNLLEHLKYKEVVYEETRYMLTNIDSTVDEIQELNGGLHSKISTSWSQEENKSHNGHIQSDHHRVPISAWKTVQHKCNLQSKC